MHISHLYLKNFRNYKEACLTFSPKINFIYGENAQGKTNLLEAIYLLITGRSFRTHHLEELIRFGETSFYLEACFTKSGIEHSLKFSFDGEKRKILYNATSLPSLSSLFGILNGVILSPEDHELITGSPSGRRQFLDLQIAQINPLYLHHLSRYMRAMKQRNALLKQQKMQTIEIWEEQMAQSAEYITQQRHIATRDIEELLDRKFENLRLSYKSSALAHTESFKTYFMKQFAKFRPREFLTGTTLMGPHRDDLDILIEGKEAALFGSEGQKRSSIASLRLAEWSRLNQIAEEIPLMCIDDVGISLDQKREENLYSRVERLGQVFLTSPYPRASLHPKTQLIRVEEGHPYTA